MNNELQVAIKGLLPTPNGCGIFLGREEKVIAIFVDHHVAAAITMLLNHVKKPRPLTHDLIANILAGLSVKVLRVVVNDLKQDTFYARIYLKQVNELGCQLVEIDARPSDSIALAIQQNAPIYVCRPVWEKAEDMSWALQQAQHPPSDVEPPTPEDSAPPPGE